MTRRPLSNVTFNLDYTGVNSAVLVDGFPMRGVRNITVSTAAHEVTVATLELIGATTGYPVDRSKMSTPIFDQLVAERGAA